MNISELLSPERLLLDVDITCAKHAFRMVAEKVATESGLNDRQIIDALVERERLGSTGVGGGISIPHARFEGLKKPISCFLRLNDMIDLDAPDDKPIKLIFVLLAPEDANADHLKVLARIARIMRSPDNQAALKQNNTSAEEVMRILTSEDQ